MSMLQTFSTSALPPALRHDAWVERGGAGIGRLVDTRPDGAFDMWSEHLALGPVGIDFGAMSAQHYERTAERCRRDDVDHVSFCLMLEGEMRGVAGDRGFVAGVDALSVLDIAQPGRHYSTASRTVLIALPRPMALARFGTLQTLHGVVADAASSRLLRTYLTALHKEAHGGFDEAVSKAIGRSVLSLLEVTLAMAGHAGQASVGARDDALKLAAIDEIARRLDWHGLDADYLCGRLSVSRTALYQAFEPDGGVHAYVRRARLDRVYSALSNSASVESIGDLAVRWHFSDASHLSRLFRAAYGLSPSDVRRQNAGR